MVAAPAVAEKEARMKTIRRLVHREVISAVAFVTLGFLALFFFFDMVDELRWVGRSPTGGYQLSHAMLFVALSIPSHLYELLPITVLIGTIFVMARLAQSSEFTIMRTSGLGPGRALRTLLALGSGFVILTFCVGDYVAPLSDRAAQFVKARYLGRITTGATGAWLKERQEDKSFAINVRAISTEGAMLNVRIFEFDAKGRLVSQTRAATGQFERDGAWTLNEVSRSSFISTGTEEASVEHLQAPSLRWPTHISADMIAATVLKPDRMATLDLFQYIRHLEANGQAAQRYEIEFWRKVFYPLSCLVMVVLALPFAYLHFRSGGITGYVFGGVMAGISFFLLNNLFGFAGNLQNWSPWLTAAAPGLIYSVLSLAAFGWLVLRR
jgi:lipopolysaccharide export system permease protein